jgi:hypothetical protein
MVLSSLSHISFAVPCSSTDADIVDISIRVLHRTGLFAKEYKAWITRGDDPCNSMTFAAFHSFWETAVNIAAFMATSASQHGYGMAADKDNASTASLTNAVNNFGAAFAATQESLRSNNASINTLQLHIQLLCNTIGNQPPRNDPVPAAPQPRTPGARPA